METIKIRAYAKINLTLDVLNKRDDGYHDVSMVLQSISLYDTLRLSKEANGITLAVENMYLPADEANLAWKAAKIFFDTQKISGGVKIQIKKRIPVAAGLAGGSADAAAVLRGMNELFEQNLSVEELCRMGEAIGSDVPFCIIGGTAFASGRGEIVETLAELPELHVVVAKPPISVSTAWAYENYDANPASVHPDNEKIKKAIAEGDIDAVGELLCNVLESVTVNAHGIIGEYKKMFAEKGAPSLMSGSGPAVFALAKSENEAKELADFMRQNTEAQVFVTTTVRRNYGETHADKT